MIFAEGFECTVPSADAIKEAVIHCNARPSNGWEISEFIINVFVAVGTVGAAVVALWLGLRTIRENRRLASRREQREFEHVWKEESAKYSVAMKVVSAQFPQVTIGDLATLQIARDSYIAHFDQSVGELSEMAREIVRLDALAHAIVDRWNGVSWVDEFERVDEAIKRNVMAGNTALHAIAHTYLQLFPSFHLGKTSAAGATTVLREMNTQLWPSVELIDSKDKDEEE